MERHQETRIAPAPAGELDAVVAQDPLERALASARAPGADGGVRRVFVDRLATLDLGSPRATADRLQALLASGALESLRTADGTSARAAAVERLLGLWAIRTRSRCRPRTSPTGGRSGRRGRAMGAAWRCW